MKKAKTVYVCNQCGGEHLTWAGRCNFCGAWNTLQAVNVDQTTAVASAELSAPEPLNKIKAVKNQSRSTGIGELDRVLGGGLVAGSVVLLSGDPGIGKSTLLLSVAKTFKGKILYLAGEESPQQVKIRSDRIAGKVTNLDVTDSPDVGVIEKYGTKYDCVLVDSIQTVMTATATGSIGSIAQVRESAQCLVSFAKKNHIPVIIVGHVTKEGVVAGPRTLEHMVDVVLYLEGQASSGLRILRGVKNRFGPTDEIGLFEMTTKGLEQVTDPTSVLLSTDREESPGTVVAAALEGSRVFLAEVQALTATTVFGYPRRTSVGYDLNRLHLILAILTRRAGLNLLNQDVYLNIGGGLIVKDPAMDLAVALAIASSFLKVPLRGKQVFCGELSLTGQVRKPFQYNLRQKEVTRLGWKLFPPQGDIASVIKKILSDRSNP